MLSSLYTTRAICLLCQLYVDERLKNAAEMLSERAQHQAKNTAQERPYIEFVKPSCGNCIVEIMRLDAKVSVGLRIAHD